MEPVPTMLLPIFDGNVFSWKVVLLALRINNFAANNDLGDPRNAEYLHGLCEAFAIMVGENEQAISVDAPPHELVKMGETLIPVDAFGFSAAISWLIMLGDAAQQHPGDVLHEQYCELGCIEDLTDYVMRMRNDQVDRAMVTIDTQIEHLLDNNE